MSITIPGIQEKINIIELHKIINRCDIVKDASIAPPSISVNEKNQGSLFGDAANALFNIKVNKNLQVKKTQ